MTVRIGSNSLPLAPGLIGWGIDDLGASLLGHSGGCVNVRYDETDGDTGQSWNGRTFMQQQFCLCIRDGKHHHLTGRVLLRQSEGIPVER